MNNNASRFGRNDKNADVSIFGILILGALIEGCLWYNSFFLPSESQAETIASVIKPVTHAPELALTPERAMPIPPQQGRGEPMEDLIPMYAEEYAEIPEFKDIVVSFRRWEWNAVYSGLDTIVRENPDNLDAYRLQAEAYMINQNYDADLAQLDQILRRDPADIHALGVTTVLMRIVGNTEGEAERLAALEMVSPEAASAVTNMLFRAEELFNAEYSNEPKTDMIPDAITVFGQTPKSDGTPSSGMLSRLEVALKLAERYPNAVIILSGGDVKTEYTEASVMKTWLVEQGIDDSRIILDEAARDTLGNAIGTLIELEKRDAHKLIAVGTMLHIPRATTTMTLYAEHQGYDLEIDSVGGGEVAVKDEDERLYTYVIAARASGLFTKSDFSIFVN